MHPLLAEAFAALDEAGVEWCLLRGEASLASPSGDVDLLVSPAELPRAESVATGLGFQPLASESQRIQRESHHSRWYRPLDNVSVELHRGFLGVEATDEEFWDELVRETGWVYARANRVPRIVDELLLAFGSIRDKLRLAPRGRADGVAG